MSFETSMKCFIRRFSTVEESHFSSHVSRHSWYSTVRERDAHRLNLRSRLANRKLVLCICSRIDCFDIYAKHLLRYVSTDGVEQTALPDTRSLFLLVRHQINITIRPMVVNSLWRHTILITTFVFFFLFLLPFSQNQCGAYFTGQDGRRWPAAIDPFSDQFICLSSGRVSVTDYFKSPAEDRSIRRRMAATPEPGQSIRVSFCKR